MPQSLVRNLVHLIFSTKHRQPSIAPDLRPKLEAYLRGILKNLDSPALRVGAVADHVHVLLSLSKNHALCRIVEEVKKSSSKWMKEIGGPPDFHWQNGYGGFSVSPSNEPRVIAYIARQEEHHRRHTFQEELRNFFHKHGMTFDERYVWD